MAEQLQFQCAKMTILHERAYNKYLKLLSRNTNFSTSTNQGITLVFLKYIKSLGSEGKQATGTVPRKPMAKLAWAHSF